MSDGQNTEPGRDRQPRYGAYRDPSQPGPAPTTIGSPYQPGLSVPPAGQPGYPTGHQQYGAGQQSYVDPYATSPMGGAPMGGPYSQPPQKLPGRGLPITLIVIGALIAFLVAPIVGVGVGAWSVVQGLDIDKLASQAEGKNAAPNPDTIEVGDNTMIAAMLMSPDESDGTCTAKDAAGDDVAPVQTQKSNSDSNSVTTYVFRADNGGKYTVTCKTADDKMATSMAVTVVDIHDIGRNLVVWAGLTFLIGLGVMVWGIVWLSRRNAERRQVVLGGRRY
ncbi:MAG: hypothetical protein E7A62_02335 [Actinomycetaceae bacterium]|nr:hypothetical protein [Actinomycetaceae bacterium]MDU0969818.1 hypothetical protein [Actinomycetaceae bacterium]